MIVQNLMSGLYYKLTTIVNYASSIISEQSFQLIDDASVVIYDRHVFIVQASGHSKHSSLVLHCAN